MTCPRCQEDNPTHARFCLGCGARLALACGACGAELPGGARFCLQCGQAVAGSAAAPVRSLAPETYTPRDLAEKILTSKSALEGERKQVTVLFADLKGSMELLADRDPEEARKLLDPVLEHMMDAVHRYEGTVNQVMGDGIMALFGAPLAHEDHAVLACYAALWMQESVKRYAGAVRRDEGVTIRIRVGLHSGEVVVRAIGSDLHMDYTAVGQTTHLAARMEQLAEPGTTLLTPATLALAEDFVQVKSLGPVRVKGLGEAIEVYELTGANPVRSRFQAHAARGLTRFVGRELEIDHLRHVLERARGGHGQVVALVGEPGVGKSRLFWEFARSASSHGWLVVDSGAVSFGTATAYLPVIGWLKTFFRIEPGDDADRIREKVSGHLLTHDESLMTALPVFLALLGAPVEDPTWEALDPPQLRQRTLDACKRFFLRESQIQPLCLVLEDLHWIDSETQALLDSLVENLPTARMLLLVTHRPEYQHRWGHYTGLRIDPLAPEGADQLLQALLGDDRSLQPLKQRLIERTQGNPFFLEESVRTLVETGVLVRKGSGYGLAGALPTIQVPPTVQAVIAARIDRLAPEEKTLLQTAAVIGKDVQFALLAAIADRTEEDLHRGLARLRAAEFVYETRLFPELEYTFKHVITHEVAYEGLLQERRRGLHARIVGAIKRLHADNLIEHIERLAHHAVLGEVWGEAVTYLRGSGRKAAAYSGHHEAVACFERALNTLARLPRDPDTIRLAVDIRFELKTALTPLAEWGRVFECLREAEDLAKTLGDDRRLGRVSAYTSDCARVMGDHERALEAGRRGLAIADAIRDVSLQVNINTYLGLAHYFLGDYRQAVGFFRKNVESVTGELVRERFEMAQPPSVHSRVWLACCLAEIGDFDEGIARSDEGLQIAASLGHPLSLALAYFGIGQLRLQRGDFQEAIGTLERGLELTRRCGLQLWFLNVAAALGSAYALSGRISPAVALVEEAVEGSVAMKRTGLHSIRVAALGQVYLLAGRLGDARESARRALALAREHKERGCEASTLHLLGEIAARRDSPDADGASADYLAALALAEELGMRPLVARCHLGLGRLSRRADNQAKARTHLGVAVALFRTTGMPSWLTQAEAELSGLL